jgi:hypothetical protein
LYPAVSQHVLHGSKLVSDAIAAHTVSRSSGGFVPHVQWSSLRELADEKPAVSQHALHASSFGSFSYVRWKQEEMSMFGGGFTVLQSMPEPSPFESSPLELEPQPSNDKRQTAGTTAIAAILMTTPYAAPRGEPVGSDTPPPAGWIPRRRATAP